MTTLQGKGKAHNTLSKSSAMIEFFSLRYFPFPGDDASLPKKQMELLSDILKSAFFNSVKDVSIARRNQSVHSNYSSGL